MSRVVRSPWLVALLVDFLLSSPLSYASGMRTTESLAATAPIMPTILIQQQPPGHAASDLIDELLRAGLDAKAPTAVELSANGTAALVAAFRDAYTTGGAAVDQADTAFSDARVSFDTDIPR